MRGAHPRILVVIAGVYLSGCSALANLTQLPGTRVSDDQDDDFTPALLPEPDAEPATPDCSVTFARTDGSTVDFTSTVSASSTEAPAEITLDGGGTLALCEGVFRVRLIAHDPTDVVVIEGEGQGVTELLGNPFTATLDLAGGPFEVRDLTLRGGLRGIDATCAKLRLDRVDIVGHVAPDRPGGGLRLLGGDECVVPAEVVGGDLRIEDNLAETGAGLYARNAAVRLYDLTVAGNRAELDGGGIAAVGRSTVSLTSAMFARNGAQARGAGLWLAPLHDATSRLIQTTFLSNESWHGGGGLQFDPANDATLELLKVHFSGDRPAAAGLADGTTYAWEGGVEATCTGVACD